MPFISSVHLLPRLAAALAGLLFVSVVHSQKLEPGLWEVSTSSAGSDAMTAQMQSRMAEMTPKQRQMVEQMLAGQGIGIGAKANAVRICISPEQAARAEPPAEAGCQHEVLQRSGDMLKMRFECVGPPPSKGEGEYRLAGPKAYRGRVVAETVHNGQPQRFEMEQAGRWIGADCGSIKPRGTR